MRPGVEYNNLWVIATQLDQIMTTRIAEKSMYNKPNLRFRSGDGLQENRSIDLKVLVQIQSRLINGKHTKRGRYI